MLNQYPLWKYLLITAVLLVGSIYALPNLYSEDPAVQVSSRNGEPVPAELMEQISTNLKQQNMAFKTVGLENGNLLIRFNDTETQLKAIDRVRAWVGRGYVAALNLAQTTPKWLQALGAKPMFLGLDLRGGVHFLLEVDMKAAIAQTYNRYVGDFKTTLRENKIYYQGIREVDNGVELEFKTPEITEQARSVLHHEFPDLELAVHGSMIMASLSEQALQNEKKQALLQNVTTLRNRVDELGVSEPVVQMQGEDRIVVQLAGVQDTARAKEILGATATLEFRLVEGGYNEWAEAARTGHAPVGSRLYYERDGNPILLKRQVIVTGDQITGASSGIEQQNGSPAVFINLDSKGARKMSSVTRENIGKPMAVVFIENKVETVMENDQPVKHRYKVEEVINVATIRDQLSNRFQISGLDNSFEAHNLALLLRAGSLRAPVEIVEERTVGPSLGADNIQQGFWSVVVGFALVLLFMLAYYRLFGLFANVALSLNLVLILAIMSMIQATLTLPGIAGIVLTVGMAVDANVLIFARIKEELAIGQSVQNAIHSGYERAVATIFDANITTLLAALVLFGFGTGPIKGFAITLSIGILTSMFTAIVVTRGLVNLTYGGRRQVKTLSI